MRKLVEFIKSEWNDWKYPLAFISVPVALCLLAIAGDRLIGGPPKSIPEMENIRSFTYRFQTETVGGVKVTCFTYHDRGISCVKEEQ